MGSSSVLSGPVFTWVIMPLLIFVARICDVTIGTIRIIAISRGNKFLSPLLGVFEVLIWLLAIRQIMQNLTNFFYYLVYAGGFGAGTFVGMFIEEKLAMGVVLVRVITRTDASQLICSLRAAGHGVTVVEAQGTEGRVHVVYTIIKRSNLGDVVAMVNEFNPRAFYSTEDVRSVREGTVSLRKVSYRRGLLALLRLCKKAE